jgi:transposase
MNAAPTVILSRHERTALEFLATDTLGPRALRKRAQAILICAKGKTNLQVASEIAITNLTVGRWRREFLLNRLKDFGIERRGRPLRPLVLTSAERRMLRAWLRSPSISADLAICARVILACSQGASKMAIASETGVSEQIVSRIRHRFLSSRLVGIRSGPPKKPVAPRMLSSHERATFQERQQLQHSQIE